MNAFERIKSYHFDVLKEVGNIGAGNAATALSNLLNRNIDMKVPSVKVVSFQGMTDLVGGSDKVVAAIFLRIEGKVTGSMFFLMPLKEAEELIQRITRNRKFQFHTPPYEEMGLSAFQEVGNILAGSYLTALSNFTNLNLQASVPAVSIDMAGAILNDGLVEISHVGDYAIVIDTKISEMEGNARQSTGHFFLLPDPQSFAKLFHTLGVKIDE